MSETDVCKLSESDFMSHIVCTICDYAKENGYDITDTVKAICENLIDLTDI